MIKDTDIERYVSAPSLLTDLCMQVVERLDVEVPTQDSISNTAAMVAQLREIAKTIARLENLSVPIPDVLRAEKTRLAAALSIQDAATNSLEQLAESMGSVQREIRARLHRRKRQLISTGVYDNRINPERLPKSVLCNCIIQALHSLGGSAPKEKVLSIMESELQGRFLPGDLIWLDSVKKYAWQNAARHARSVLVRDGILRSDSPIGIWELSAGHV